MTNTKTIVAAIVGGSVLFAGGLVLGIAGNSPQTPSGSPTPAPTVTVTATPTSNTSKTKEVCKEAFSAADDLMFDAGSIVGVYADHLASDMELFDNLDSPTAWEDYLADMEAQRLTSSPIMDRTQSKVDDYNALAKECLNG